MNKHLIQSEARTNLGIANTQALDTAETNNPQGAPFKSISSDILFSGARELMIQHADDTYRLRITNQGKLILTK